MIRVEVPGTPPTPNATRRLHWAARAAEAKRWRRDAYYAALAARNRAPGPFPIRACDLRVVILTATNVRRDPDNAIASVKPLIDGLVDAGLIVDDSADVVRSLAVSIRRDAVPRVVLEVTPR